MSAYGTEPPPPNPYGSASPYGGQQLPPEAYAHWIKRVGAFLLDYLVVGLAAIPFIVGIVIAVSGLESSTDAAGTVTTTGSANPVGVVIAVVGGLAYLAFVFWNYFIKQGRTGYTIGKGVLGIKLISEKTGEPIGILMCVVRSIAHIADTVICYIGYLFPLWDSKRQTLADKIVSTVVLEQPKP